MPNKNKIVLVVGMVATLVVLTQLAGGLKLLYNLALPIKYDPPITHSSFDQAVLDQTGRNLIFRFHKKILQYAASDDLHQGLSPDYRINKTIQDTKKMGIYDLETDTMRWLENDFSVLEVFGDMAIVEAGGGHYLVDLTTNQLAKTSLETDFRTATGYELNDENMRLLDAVGTILIHKSTVGIWIRYSDGSYEHPFDDTILSGLSADGVLCQMYRDPITHNIYEVKYTIQTKQLSKLDTNRSQSACTDSYHAISKAGDPVTIEWKNNQATLITEVGNKALIIDSQMLLDL